jgi:hypothetical protein
MIVLGWLGYLNNLFINKIKKPQLSSRYYPEQKCLEIKAGVESRQVYSESV